MATRFTFIRDSKKRPVGCVAYRVEPDITSGTDTLEFEVSTHNPADPFDRSLGRFVAEGRMKKHPKRLCVAHDVNCIDEILLYLLGDPSVPQRLKRAIKRCGLNYFLTVSGDVRRDLCARQRLDRRFSCA